jgi:hypothetical protein
MARKISRFGAHSQNSKKNLSKCIKDSGSKETLFLIFLCD